MTAGLSLVCGTRGGIRPAVGQEGKARTVLKLSAPCRRFCGPQSMKILHDHLLYVHYRHLTYQEGRPRSLRTSTLRTFGIPATPGTIFTTYSYSSTCYCILSSFTINQPNETDKHADTTCYGRSSMHEEIIICSNESIYCSSPARPSFIPNFL